MSGDEVRELKELVKTGFREVNESITELKIDVAVIKNEYADSEKTREIARDEVRRVEKKSFLSPNTKDILIKVAIGLLSIGLTAAGFGVVG